MAASFFVNTVPFLDQAGDPPVPYQQWKRSIENAMACKEFHLQRLQSNAGTASTGAGGSAAQQAAPYTDEEKNRDVFMHLGVEGQRRFSGTQDADNFQRSHTIFISVLDALFDIPKSRLIARQK